MPQLKRDRTARLVGSLRGPGSRLALGAPVRPEVPAYVQCAQRTGCAASGWRDVSVADPSGATVPGRGGPVVSRTWLSIRVALVSGRGAELWPRPGRILAAARSHSFGQLADAQRFEPLDELGVPVAEPQPYFGWEEPPDRYGRRCGSDDGGSAPPRRPARLLADLPPILPWWGPRQRGR
jgi:hypothetical protein